MKKKITRYNPMTDKRVNLYDYEGFIKGKRHTKHTNNYGGRMYDVSIASLRAKLQRFHPNYSWVIRLVKRNSQLRKENVGRDWL